MVLVATTIEDNGGDARFLRLLGDQEADLLGRFGLGALEVGEVAHQRGFAHQGLADGVVDNLGNHMTVGTGDHQTREFCGAVDALTDTSVATLQRNLLAFTENLNAHITYQPFQPCGGSAHPCT